jgi:hypothetical protein
VLYLLLGGSEPAVTTHDHDSEGTGL